MTTVMNEKLAKAYIKALEDKLLKRIKQCTKKVTTEDVVTFILELLPSKTPQNNQKTPTLQEANRIIHDNHDIIIDQCNQIEYLKRKNQLEDELTASFIKNLLRDKSNQHDQSASRMLDKKGLLRVPSISCQETSISDSRMSRITDSGIADRSPISKFKKDENGKNPKCHTSRSKISLGRDQSYEVLDETETEDGMKAFKKLRVLEKLVFGKENADKSGTKLWNGGISPTKMRYQEENKNLKVIQSNLVTHLTLLQKYRQIPSIEGLVAREEALKKKESHLKQLGETLEKKEVSLNRKHSEFLKKQKSLKVL